MNHVCARMGKGRTPKHLEAVYDDAAKRVDSLGVDQVFRIQKKASPSPKWYGVRAKLNDFIVSVKAIDDSFVVLRLK